MFTFYKDVANNPDVAALVHQMIQTLKVVTLAYYVL